MRTRLPLPLKLAAFLLACCSSLPFASAQHPKPELVAGLKKTVAIVVGPEKHAPGTHETKAGGRLMAWCLNHMINRPGVTAKVFYSWPAKEDFLKNADAVVFIGDQFPGERLGESETAMADLKAMTAKGCGVVCVHYATGLGADDVAADGDHPLLHWTGGYFATRCNHHQSKAKEKAK